jgi:hypothetical protein
MNNDFRCHFLPIPFLDLVLDVAPRYSPQFDDGRLGNRRIPSVAPSCRAPRLVALYDLEERRLTMDEVEFNMPVLSASPMGFFRVS